MPHLRPQVPPVTPQDLHDFVASSPGNESNICQIHAIKDGVSVLDDCWHGFAPPDAVNVMSVTKGVMALLVGIAIDKGLVGSVDQKVLDFFPSYRVKRGEKTVFGVTVRHLLTMTAPYKYRSEPWKKVCTSPDWTVAALDLLGGRAGITGEFKYATLGIQILAGIIENASGEKCIDFANKNFFVPLGIPGHAVHLDGSKEDQLAFLLDKRPRKNEWYADPRHTVTAGWGLCLSARDLAKIGQLILDDGLCNGQRIVSAAYLRDMLAPHLELPETFGSMSYGYLWYKPFRDRPIHAALGDGGNVVYANREKNVAIGVTGTFKPRIFDRLAFIESRVLPLVEAL